MTDQLEIKKLKAEIWNTWLSAIAIVIGGIWVLFVFYALREAYLAEAAVADIEARNIALELRLEEKELENNYWVVSVIIENKGIFPVDINLQGEEVFTISKIEDVVSLEQVDVSNTQKSRPYNLITPEVLRSISSVTVFPGTASSVHYLVELPADGVHFASFISEITPNVLQLINRQERGDLGEVVTHGSAWMAQKYFSTSSSHVP